MGRSAGRLAEAIDEWIDAQRRQGMAAGTIKQRENTLRKFLGVTSNLYVASIGDAHVTRFLAVYQESWSKTSIEKAKLALAEFFYWIQQNRYNHRPVYCLYGTELYRRMPTPRRGYWTLRDRVYDP